MSEIFVAVGRRKTSVARVRLTKGALEKMDSSLRAALKKDGLMTRDPRSKERKKSGQPGARKRFQFSKR